MAKVIPIKIKLLFPDVEIPKYATEGDAGFDLKVHNFKRIYSSTDVDFNDEGDDPSLYMNGIGKVVLEPHSRLLVGCGYSLELPEGKYIVIHSRSGLAMREGLCMANGVGVVDNGYRGEMGVLLLNSSEFAIYIGVGDRVAQAIIMDYSVASFEVVSELSETKRGIGGFGHTGK